MIRIEAPAKVNLTLEVLGDRPDGFHEVRSVMQAVSLCDVLEFAPARKTGIQCDLPGWDAARSLVSRAVTLLREAAGSAKGASIAVTKRIPMSSGLGGDSSAAAATLNGLNRLWRLGLSRQRLLELAPRLGSDVAFFLLGGTALAEGRGEIVQPLPPIATTSVLLFLPDVYRPEKKTAQLYASLNANHYTDGAITERFAERVRRGQPPEPAMVFNTFENVAFDIFPGLSAYRGHLLKLGASNIHLAGSGPALFSLAPEGASDLLERCREQGIPAWLAETVADSFACH